MVTAVINESCSTFSMPEVWRERNHNSSDSLSILRSAVRCLCTVFFCDISVFWVGLTYVQLPYLLLGDGKQRMAGIAHSLFQARVPSISRGSHTANSVVPIKQLLWTLVPERDHFHPFSSTCVMQMQSGALGQLMYSDVTTCIRTGLNIL